jgi:hypothetical protein
MRSHLQAFKALFALLVASPGSLAAADLPLGDLVHPPPPQISFYDRVAAAGVVVRVKGEPPDHGDDRFAVEEVLKGRPGADEIHVAWPRSHGSYPPGERALLTLDRDGDLWKPSGELFLGGGDDAAEIELWREYARIAARPDRGERERALADLRRRAEEERGHRDHRSDRYPITTTDDLDAHFHVPSPLQPFADLVGFYWHAAREDERVAALWAIEESGHPEAPDFLLGLLTSGRDLGWELVPIAYSLAARGDEPSVAHLAAALGADAEPFARRAGLEAFVRLAEPRDVDLAWRRLAEIEHDRFWEGLALAPWLAAHTRTAELAARYRRLPAPAKLALVGAATAHPEATFLRDLILAGDDPRGRYRRLAAAALARELDDAPAESPRRRAALFLAASSAEGGWRPRWWMLEKARGEEADVLLTWFSQHPPGAAAAPALLVPIVRQMDEEASATAPWLPPRRAAGDEWIARSCAAGDATIGAAVLGPWSAAAGEADAPLLVEALARADRARAEILLPYFVRHPDPDALPSLRRLYDEPRLGRRTLAEALSACGDTAVVDAGFELLAHRWNKADVAWAMAVIALSPLPETGDRVLALDREQRDAMLYRYARMGDASPIRRPVLEALLAGWIPDKQVSDAPIRALLGRLVASGEEWARPYLDRLPPPASMTVY